MSSVVVMLGPLFFQPAIGRGAISVRCETPDEVQTLIQDTADRLEPNSVDHLHIILKSSSISSLFDDYVVNAFCEALVLGAEIQVHVLASNTFSPVQEADVEEIRNCLMGGQNAHVWDMYMDGASDEEGGNWILTAQKKGGHKRTQTTFPFGTLPYDLAGVAKFIQSDQCQRILILAGAGMSVACGIPDFRSAGGLYDTLRADSLTCEPVHRQAIEEDPTFALNLDLFLKNPLPMLEVKRAIIVGTQQQRWKASLAHRFVELLFTKTKGKLVRLYTQNTDCLENQCLQLPKEKVMRVHGTMDKAHCVRCKSPADFDTFIHDVRTKIKDITCEDASAPAVSTPIPCATCGYNAVKPSVVLFGEAMPDHFYGSVESDVEDVDLLIVIGTSLQVAPANSMVMTVPDTAMRVLVDREIVGEDLGMNFSNGQRDYFAKGSSDEVLLELMQHLGWLPDLVPLLKDQKLPPQSAEFLCALLQEKVAKVSH